VEAARCELAAAFCDDLRRTGTQLRGTNNKLTTAVRATGTSLTGLSGAGPSSPPPSPAAPVTLPASRAAITSPPATAPRRSRFSCGKPKAGRLSRRGNRRLNHAIHLAAITQIRQRHSDGRACFEKKLAEGTTRKKAPRALKRRLSDAIFARLRADARPAAAHAKSPGGQQGNDSAASAARSHPKHRLFGQPTPGPGPTLRPRPAPRRAKTTTARKPRKTS
jgi:transposase